MIFADRRKIAFLIRLFLSRVSHGRAARSVRANETLSRLNYDAKSDMDIMLLLHAHFV